MNGGDAELRRKGEDRLAGEPSQFGPYRIEAALGAGGMGEVFRVRDTRLHRTVAIKVLNRDRIADPERRRRFLLEARAASALNHPNIVALYDIASENGVDYLVLEYVPGESLDKGIAGLPLTEAIGYAAQIADALAAAHAAGIVHRDIKPANAIVTAEGQVKILDFGLAKLSDSASPDDETRTCALTEAGTVMGTAAYMSPEQASGRPIDHRTDIFSLGVMLYEMVSGKRPFVRKTQAETMSAIINDPAPPPEQPPELLDVLDKALAKDPRDRYQHAGDFALDLRRFERALKTKSLPSMRSGPTASASYRWRPWAAGVVLAVAAGIAGWFARGAASHPPNPLANAHFTRLTNFESSELDAAISPDGRLVAFLSDRDGPFDIWLAQIGAGQFVNLTRGKIAEIRGPLRSVGFSASGAEIWLGAGDPGRRLRLMPVVGGEPRNFLGETAVNVAWSPDGARVAYHTFEPGDPLYIADRTGAHARRILVSAPGTHNHYPAWSADGRWIYFVRGRPDTDEMDVWRVPSAGGDPERLTRHDNRVAYPTPIDASTVLYVACEEDGSGPWLWALDPNRKIRRRVSFGLEQFTSLAASADGRRLVASVANPQSSLWSVPILDRVAGESDVKPFPVPAVRALAPRFGGSALFYLSSRGAGDGLWRYQDGRATEIWNGAEGALRGAPALSPDGSAVVITLRKSGKLRLHVLSADGAQLRALAETLDARGSASWSPDGKWIACGGNDGKGLGLFKIPAEGGAPARLTATQALDPVWSPDGSMIAYVGPNVATSAPLLAVRPDGTRVELPAIRLRREGERVRFLPDGKGLVYMQGLLASQDFWLVDLATRKTRQLTQLNATAAMRSFDITPEGGQIVFDRLRDNSDVVLIELARSGK